MLSLSSEVFNGVVTLFFFPEAQVLFKEFNNGFGVSEGFLINIVNFLEGFGQSGFTELTSFLMVIENLILEN